MSADLDQLLLMMHTVSAREAARIPTPSEPADDAWERAADEFCYRFARTMEAELPSPEVASALMPRLKAARLFAGTVEHQLDMQARLGDRAADEHAILEWLLVKLWHESWRDQWLAGKFE